MIDLDDHEAFKRFLLSAPSIVTSFHKSPVQSHVDAETRKLAEHTAKKAATFASALIQLSNVLKDLQTTARMLRRYPWHGTRISKSDHIELHWFLFENLCYMFKEKLKLTYNNQIAACNLLGLHKPIWLKSELSEVDRTFRREIAARGNSVHSWNERNEMFELYSLVSTLHEMRKSSPEIDLPEELVDEKRFYLDARDSVALRASHVISGAESIVIRILTQHSPSPQEIMLDAKKIIDDVNSLTVKLERK